MPIIRHMRQGNRVKARKLRQGLLYLVSVDTRKPSRWTKQFFFEKKNQKTFVHLDRAYPEKPKPKKTKVFCFFFSKKKTFFRNQIRVSKQTGYFLKKRSKKLLPVLASAFPDGLSPDNPPGGRRLFSKKNRFLPSPDCPGICGISPPWPTPPRHR